MSSPFRTVESAAELERELSRFPGTSRAVLLVGGADFTDADPGLRGGIGRFLETLARVCDAAGAAVVDGGTDAGVMRWFGEAREAVAGSFPLIGVAPAGAFGRDTRDGGDIAPADRHSLVLAVPGDRFGDEMPWLFDVLERLGSGAPTIVVNGGELAAREARQRLADGAVVLAVEGSGRAADELAAAVPPSHGDLQASGRLRVIPLGIDEPALAAALEEAWTR